MRLFRSLALSLAIYTMFISLTGAIANPTPSFIGAGITLLVNYALYMKYLKEEKIGK